MALYITMQPISRKAGVLPSTASSNLLSTLNMTRDASITISSVPLRNAKPAVGSDAIRIQRIVLSALRSGLVRFFCPFGFELRLDRFFISQKSMKNWTRPYRTGSLQFILVTEPVLTGFRPNPVRTGLYYIKWVLCIYNYYIIKWNL